MSDSPAWKEDFPIAWTDDHFVTRREFTKSLVLVSCASFVANASVATLEAFQEAPKVVFPAVRVATAGELPVGGSRVFHYPGPNEVCLLVRIGSERYVAYSQKCTHLGCPVHYQAEVRKLYCPCHEGFFNVDDGRVLAGPPPRPLAQIRLEKRGEELWAIGKTG
ncbi:MAG: Rieske 2Fe-2S domain-containing protein [Acidobacteria bacterium]|nr:Rieske 2Fe-2S domain-containing protein [Acidobacteriota bacterium]MCI0620899.1 Rieske 2Fe-2S domain-containing protein [Acidobacteriota bacterium]MCI0720363.1 Rieske 2Fe-2S domain-containing protein [Acidobacteriota bacterium]